MDRLTIGWRRMEARIHCTDEKCNKHCWMFFSFEKQKKKVKLDPIRTKIKALKKWNSIMLALNRSHYDWELLETESGRGKRQTIDAV